MTDYRHPETVRAVIDHIEEGGDAVFQQTFKNRLWFPIALSASLLFVAVAYLFMPGTNPVNKTLDVVVALILVIMIWGWRYMQAQVAASDSKYAHATSYLDNLQDEDEYEPDA